MELITTVTSILLTNNEILEVILLENLKNR